jgi:hypothetical protein
LHDHLRTTAVFFLFALLAACSETGTVEPGDPPVAENESIGDHVTFYGTGKVARYQQHMDSSLEYLGPLFFAEIFIAAGGEVTDASVKFPPPVSETKQLEYRYSESDEIGDVMYLSGRAESDEELERNYPSGAYPTQPVIIFEQGGQAIPFESVDADQDLRITWAPFAEGRADKNGVLDDLIFVAIDSCVVEDMVHSGRPFEKDDNLTFRAEDYTVAAGTLAPGQTYSMYLEHALLPNTQRDYGMPAFATFAASTYMDFKTIGETDPAYCE